MPKMYKRILQFLMIILLVDLAGCSIFRDDDEREKTRILTEGQLYERIQEMLDDKTYDLAVENLQLLESRFPFGVYAEQAQLEIIYAYYKSGEEAAAVASADRFLQLHPDHPDADYAWYMKGLANYTLKPGLLSRFYKVDYAAKDIEPARLSFFEFQNFVRFFPNSPYAADARVRMINIKHALARHEVIVANYYIKRRSYSAAISRAKIVIEEYQRSDAIADAMAVLAYCYDRIHLNDLALQYVDLLKINFPDHTSLNSEGEFRYGKDYDPERRSLVNRLSIGLLDAPRAPVFDNRKS